MHRVHLRDPPENARCYRRNPACVKDAYMLSGPPTCNSGISAIDKEPDMIPIIPYLHNYWVGVHLTYMYIHLPPLNSHSACQERPFEPPSKRTRFFMNSFCCSMFVRDESPCIYSCPLLYMIPINCPFGVPTQYSSQRPPRSLSQEASPLRWSPRLPR